MAPHSDHSLILLQSTVINLREIKYTFQFENSWLQEIDVEEVVGEGWGMGRVGGCGGPCVWLFEKGTSQEELCDVAKKYFGEA